MLALKFRNLKEFNLSFPPKHPISQMCGKQESLLVYKSSPTFPLTMLWTVFRAENCSICQTEENKIGWVKRDLGRKVPGSSLK